MFQSYVAEQSIFILDGQSNTGAHACTTTPVHKVPKAIFLSDLLCVPPRGSQSRNFMLDARGNAYASGHFLGMKGSRFQWGET